MTSEQQLTVNNGHYFKVIRVVVAHRFDCSCFLTFINILRAAFAPIFFSQKLQSQTVSGEKLNRTLSYKKGLSTMLIKLTPGLACFFQNVVSQFDEKYLMKMFCKQSQENDLTRLYEKLSMA